MPQRAGRACGVGKLQLAAPRRPRAAGGRGSANRRSANPVSAAETRSSGQSPRRSARPRAARCAGAPGAGPAMSRTRSLRSTAAASASRRSSAGSAPASSQQPQHVGLGDQAVLQEAARAADALDERAKRSAERGIDERGERHGRRWSPRPAASGRCLARRQRGRRAAEGSPQAHHHVALPAGRELELAVGRIALTSDRVALVVDRAVVEPGAAAADQPAGLAVAGSEAGQPEQLDHRERRRADRAESQLDDRQAFDGRRAPPNGRAPRSRLLGGLAAVASAVASVARTLLGLVQLGTLQRSSRAISSSGSSVNSRRKRPTSASSVLRQNCQ